MHATRDALEAAGVEILPGRGLDFRDPWGNLVQIVQYDEVQFLEEPTPVLRALGSAGKSERARAELRAKGIDRVGRSGCPSSRRRPAVGAQGRREASERRCRATSAREQVTMLSKRP